MPQQTLDLIARADALKAQGDWQQAIALYRSALQREPANPYFLHNLAATLGDAGEFSESAEFARQAIKAGLSAPETRLVLARALMNTGQMEASAAAYREAISSRPDMAVALYELAQLTWMLHGDQAMALSPLREAARRFPENNALHQALVQALSYTGDKTVAAQYVLDLSAGRVANARADQALLAWGADMLLETGHIDEGRELAIQSFLMDRSTFGPLLTLIRAALACGDAQGASAALAEAATRRPLDQHVLALQAMAWRMTGDARFDQLYDYARFVKPYQLDVPVGWQSLPHYLQDLATELKAAHPFRTHPFGHSVRQGSQLPNLLSIQTPAIQAFRQAIQGPVDRHLQHLGRGSDPLRRRNTGQWAIQGIWSVWLQPGGYHTDHVHQEGWLSSACHIELPDALLNGEANDSQEGWLRFGQAGSPVQPPQTAQYAVKPQPGTLVLFPSYMWHGTVPFGGQQPRLTVALDIVPA